MGLRPNMRLKLAALLLKEVLCCLSRTLPPQLKRDPLGRCPLTMTHDQHAAVR